jgi:DNA-directed RNA polymerase beta' subunit
MEEEDFDYIEEVVQEVKDESCPALFIDRKDVKRLDRIMRSTDENLPTVAIESSLITVFDQDEIPKFAIKITSDKDEGPGTLNDPQLGSTGPDQICGRCGRNNYSCPGHFGYIQLSVPIIHPLFVNVVFSVLKSVCLMCRLTLLSEEYIIQKFGNLSGYERLKEIARNSSQQPCNNKECASINPNFDEKAFKETKKIVYELGGKKIEYSIYDVVDVFEKLSPKVVELLGFQNGAHPKNLILRYLLVLPPCDRPQAIIAGKVQPEKDKLTKSYQSIIKTNSQISSEPLNSPKRDILIRKLYKEIEDLIDSSDNSNLASAKGRKISIKQRIQGKEALIRGAIMGKKVNYFGRTVLSADPSLRYGQISIPLEWQSILTKPEVVTSFNKDYLQELLNQGKITYIIKRREKYRGKILIRNDNRRKIKLEIGDVVDRWIENGDYVLFGRHPTLHKQSMMGYEIILKPQRTIGFNPSFAAPHNLDFDGDEGNVHVPQTLDADVEIQEIANSKYCIMNAQSNNPVVGISYDALSGVYMLTQDNVEIEEELFMDMANLISCKENFGTLEKRMEQLKRPFKIFKGYREYKVYEEPQKAEVIETLLEESKATKAEEALEASKEASKASNASAKASNADAKALVAEKSKASNAGEKASNADISKPSGAEESKASSAGEKASNAGEKASGAEKSKASNAGEKASNAGISKASEAEKSKASEAEESKASEAEESKASEAEKSKASGAEKSMTSGSEETNVSEAEESMGSGAEESMGSGAEESMASGLEQSNILGAETRSSVDIKALETKVNDLSIRTSPEASGVEASGEASGAKASSKLRTVQVPVYHYTGKAAFSLLLPPDFYYSKGKVTIIQGVLYEGEITKDHVGESHNSIVQAIYKDYGPGRAADFLSDTVFLVNRWLQSVSLTVSIKDCTIQDKTIEDKINTEYQFTIGQVESILGRGQIINPIEKERQEKQVIAQLQDYKAKIGKQIQQGLSPDNTFSIMVNSKSKGNEVYIAQIIGSLGQQFIINKRAPLTISDGKRCIPYFNEDDLDPRSRGFCISSFMKGLSPAELFFHQAASREGILDTAIKTSDTGTIFRRLVKSLENLVVAEDLSVRILDKKIIQFQYGEDGFNPEALEFVQTKSGRFLSFINLKRVASKLNKKYGFIDVKQETLEDTISYVPKEAERFFEEEYDEEIEED